MFRKDAMEEALYTLSAKSKKYFWLIIIPILLLTLAFHPALGQPAEEIVIRFEVPRLVQKDISAIYRNNEVYFPIIEIFSILDINIKADLKKRMLWGQFLGEDNKFEINLPKLRAKCGKRVFELNSADLYDGATELYLKPELFDSLFNLKLFFNFSTLSVYLPLNRDFPAYQQLARKIAHQNLLDDAAAKKDMVEIPFERNLLKGGVADWTLSASPIGTGGQYGSLNIGGMLLGGDLNLEGEGNSRKGISSEQLRYRWHYYFDDSKLITQAELGQIYVPGQLGRSLKGYLLTNRPQTQRRYFQTVNLSGHLGEGWEVELYVNDRLTDFTCADQNGDYNFLTDILYGSSRILLKMYGPNGEIQTEERFLSVPFDLIPKKNLEYTFAAGFGENYKRQEIYLQSLIQYGILDEVTGGLNVDLPLSSATGETPLLAFETAYRPVGNLIFNSSISPGNSIKLGGNFSQPSFIGINSSFTKFYKNEFHNRIGQLSNFLFSVSSPLAIKGKRLGLRYHFSMDRYPNYTYYNMNYGLNGSIYKFHINYIGSLKISNSSTRTDRELSSQLFLSTSFIRWVNPQFRATFDHNSNSFSALGVYLSKRVFNLGQVSFSFERNMLTKSNFLMLTFNIFEDFAEFSSKYYDFAGQSAFTQMQRGSIRFDQDTKRFRFDRKNGVGFGSAIIKPFLDQNHNGVFDSSEQVLPELHARVEGLNGVANGRNKAYYYDGLRPYDEYIIQVDPNSFDNPQLQPAHDNFTVTVNPNTVTNINIPIVEAGEIAGVVNRVIQEGKIGVGGIRIIVVNEATDKETKISTFNNGEFYHLGLVPGKYKAYIDRDQLSKFGYKSEPSEIPFEVRTISGGDYVRDINFTIVPGE